MVIKVPITSLIEIFCLWMMAYGTMMSTGVSAISVEAMPALAYWTAMSESDTPRKLCGRGVPCRPSVTASLKPR